MEGREDSKTKALFYLCVIDFDENIHNVFKLSDLNS